jgi:hypothetical protein
MLRYSLCRFLPVFAVLLAVAFPVAAQQMATITGKITDSSGMALVSAGVHVKGTSIANPADMQGNYTLQVPAGKAFEVEFSYISFANMTIKVRALNPGEVFRQDVVMTSNYTVGGVTYQTTARDNRKQMNHVKPSDFEFNPSTTGDISSIIKNLPGVSSNTELSTQYTVRGGNYDENLVYLNDIEIFRPMLVRSGQQEGLSIINTDMVENIEFSAGGFEARYGDKMSSVLDIRYREPDSFASKVSASLLGVSATIEGCTPNHRFTYMIGGRYRTNSYLLNSLDVQGTYKPAFTDVQSLLTWFPSERFKISMLTYYGRNRYLSQPESQDTRFGAATLALQLHMDMGGQELLQYSTLLNGLIFDYDFHKGNRLKFILSGYNSDEQENYDILSDYKLQQLNTNGGEDFGKVAYTLGHGQFFDHGRNRLNSLIYNAELKGYHGNSNLFNLEWGIKFQHEDIIDHISEYQYVDSADYSVAAHGLSFPNLYDYVFSENHQQWNRYSAYAQNSFLLFPDYNGSLTAGARVNYWDYNDEFLFSPRAQFTIEPHFRYNRELFIKGAPDSLYKKNLRFKLAAGVYDQPPFYRELRNKAGILNPEIRAQRSYHFVAGQDLSFKFWNRSFKWTTEIYYKDLEDIIPYEFDNVRIRYFGQNNARGYATGIDMQLNGELVEGNPSWISMSIMKTMEDINNDSLILYDQNTGERIVTYPGFLPRPTDQRFRFSMFFQDYLPRNPTYKVHLQLVFATGWPFWPPGFSRAYVNTGHTPRLPPYRRVDIGFSKMIYDQSKKVSSNNILRHFRSIWLSAEVFNLFQIRNTVSYLWVQDINGTNLAVPSYLTGRRLNLHLEVKF